MLRCAAPSISQQPCYPTPRLTPLRVCRCTGPSQRALVRALLPPAHLVLHVCQCPPSSCLPCPPPAGSPPPLAGATLTGERRAAEKAEKSEVAFCRSLVGAKAQRAVRVACGRGSIGATPRVARPAAVKIPGAKRIKSSRKCVPSNKFRTPPTFENHRCPPHYATRGTEAEKIFVEQGIPSQVAV